MSASGGLMTAAKMKKKRSQRLHSKLPKKNYSFPVPIPPRSVVSVKAAARSPWLNEVGRVFRIGYYSRHDGLNCIWLVDEHGKYDQTIDHAFLDKFFKIESVSKERSLYERGRPQFEPYT